MPPESSADRYSRLRSALGAEPLPCSLLDLDAFESNARDLFSQARDAGKTLRIASKSIRTPDLLRRLFALGGATARGLMTYHARETAFLAEQGFDDLLLAYPTARADELDAIVSLSARGKTASVVVDEAEHLDALEAAAARAGAGARGRAVIEVDVSLRPLPGVHLGSRRSPIRSVADAVALADAIKTRPHLDVHGVMIYEGQIAGSTDRNPFTPLMNPAKRAVKLISRPRIERMRAELAAALAARGHRIAVFNGGGTGSIAWAKKEPALTELTAGSGFVDSHLFDYYRDLSLRAAAFFALQVVRKPAPGIVTCHGGGLVASGEAGVDRLPVPALPAGAKLIGFEGAGEVQTPLVLPRGVSLSLGDPVFFRHAKAGELAEHFNEYLLIRGERVETRAPTYRGMGKAFLG